MKFEFEVTGHNLTDNEITAFEAGAKVRLPPQYREFLMTANGFIPMEMIVPDTGFDADLAEFLPLYSLEKRKVSTTVHWVNDLIWFAFDSGGGCFGLAHTGRNFGKVFWIDIAHSDIDEPTSADCEIVAQSFENFMDSLVKMA